MANIDANSWFNESKNKFSVCNEGGKTSSKNNIFIEQVTTRFQHQLQQQPPPQPQPPPPQQQQQALLFVIQLRRTISVDAKLMNNIIGTIKLFFRFF